jgi:hypothetical protein
MHEMSTVTITTAAPDKPPRSHLAFLPTAARPLKVFLIEWCVGCENTRLARGIHRLLLLTLIKK